jgi:hypothetical protein
MLKIPKFNTQKEMFDFYIENEDSLIAQKCSAIKLADGFGAMTQTLERKFDVNKANEVVQNPNEIKVFPVINTTNLFDSHKDVHLPGIWDKSLKENKRIMHVQEHKSYEFDKIIASGDDVKAFTKNYNWRDLGYDAEGKTQALVFESTVKSNRNKQMFDLYQNKQVDNHSVGMRYVKIKMAINDKDYEAQKSLWDANIDKVINKADAIKSGIMWLVYEAKVIEGSAVPNGSNFVTPTLEAKSFVEDKVDAERESMLKFLNITEED